MSAASSANNHIPLTYAVPEAAKVLGVSQSFLWLRISTGDVKATRLGRRTLVSRVELERLIEATLNHKSGRVSGIAAVYNRYGYEAEKRAALDAWAEELERITEENGK